MTATFKPALDFSMHQQKYMAADIDHAGFYDLDEAFHTMICEWRIAAYLVDRQRRHGASGSRPALVDPAGQPSGSCRGGTYGGD